MKPETKKAFLSGISDAWGYPNFDDNTNFWDMLSYSWANNGANFIQGLPRFIAESGLSLGSNWLAGLIGNKLDFNSYRQKADYQFALSEKMAENAYNRQLDFWNKQNAYNTPQAMVGRMADAGLNPAQSITPQPAGGLSSVSTPMPSASSSRPNMSEGLKSFGEILTAVKNMGLLDKETELKAKELVSKQLDNDLKALAKASGFSDAMISEMNRRAKWEATYGDDVPVPDNPFISDLFPMSIVRNPHTQDYRAGEQSIATSKAQERLFDSQRTLNSAETEVARKEALTQVALAARAWADAAFIEAQESYTRTQEGIALNRDAREEDENTRQWERHEINQRILVAEELIKNATANKIMAEADLIRYEKEIAEIKSNPAYTLKDAMRKINILIHDFAGNIISTVGN
ncbi:MAG: hypothetical protein IJA96_05655 [Alistipes sp.]|nr:hypothetical protein [Alistipes sp.]